MAVQARAREIVRRDNRIRPGLKAPSRSAVRGTKIKGRAVSVAIAAAAAAMGRTADGDCSRARVGVMAERVASGSGR